MQRDFSGNIDVWLSKGTRDSWRRNENGTISVIGNMYINDPSIKKFPVKFLCINGKLKCNCPCLISVEGAPVTYKELDFYNCFFPAFFYLKAIREEKSFEDVILENMEVKEVYKLIKEKFDKENVLDILKEYLPKVHNAYRGIDVAQKFGF